MNIHANTRFLNRAIGIGALVSLFMFSCESSPSNDPPAKFNEQFTGTYNVVETITCYGSTPPCSSTSNIVVEVVAGDTDSSISFLGHHDIALFEGLQGWSGYEYHYGITFRNDSIFSQYMNGGLGAGQNEIHIGKKQ